MKRNTVVYVVEVGGMLLPNVFTSLRGACDSCGISYSTARARNMVIGNGYSFLVDGSPRTISLHTLIKQRKGRDF